MPEYPSRASSHILETASERFLRNLVPVSWVLNKPIDYGLDYYVEIAEEQHLTGLNFSIQLKAHERLSDKGEAVVVLKRSTINMYLNRLEPILLICYIESENEAYFDWFKENTIDLTRDHDNNYIKINKSNRLSKLNWGEITRHVKKIFSRKFLLNSIPEIDFSTISDAEERAAIAHYVKGEFEQSEQAYKKLLKKQVKITWLSALAMSQYSLYRYKDALVTVNKALESCDMPDLWITKACILAEGGINTKDKAKLLEAKAIFAKAISAYDDPHYYYNYANTLNELGEYDSALIFYKKTLKINPNYAQAWKNLGEVYFRTHQHKKEKQAYENALKINPDLPEALMSLGILMVRTAEDYKLALELMNRSAEISPDMFHHFQMGYYWFAKAHFKLEEFDKGYQFVQKGLNLFPGNTYLLDLKRDYYHRSWVTDPNFAQLLIDFLIFRVDLDGRDLKSFSMLIKIYLSIENYQEVLRLLEINTDLLKGIDSDVLTTTDLPIGSYLEGLPSYPEYKHYRQITAARRSEIYYIDQRIDWIVDIICMGLYHQALLLLKNGNLKNRELRLTNLVMEYVVENFPLCAPLMFTAEKDEPGQISSQMAEAMSHIPAVAMMEAGILIGNLGARFKLSESKLNKALSATKEKKIHIDITMKSFEAIQRKHRVFPEE